MGFTKSSRTALFALRAAPLQVNFLGFAGTTGAEWMDYIIADPTIIPEEQIQFYSEQVVWLPDTYQANDDKRSIAERWPRAECKLPAAGFVF